MIIQPCKDSRHHFVSDDFYTIKCKFCPIVISAQSIVASRRESAHLTASNLAVVRRAEREWYIKELES